MLYYLIRYLVSGEHYAYENVLFRGACAALFSFALVVLAGPRVIRLLVAAKLGDRPEFDHQSLNELMANKSNVPTMGGLLIVGTIILATLLLADIWNFYVQMGMLCAVWLGVLGGVDDWFKLTGDRRSGTRDGLRSYEKLLFQVGLAVLLGFFVYSYGRNHHAVLDPSAAVSEVEAYRVLSVPFYKPGLLLGTYAFMCVAVLVITGTSNAVNLTDGMDGLASGCVAMCSFVFMVFAYIVGTEPVAQKLLIPHVPASGELAVISGAILGACLGFLWYNCHPARVFMGDTGSLALGGLIGYIAVVTRQELMLFIVGGVFVFEAVSVIVQVGVYKATGGRRRVWRCTPIHHHFHLTGWTEGQVVARFWLLAGMFAILALTTVKLR